METPLNPATNQGQSEAAATTTTDLFNYWDDAVPSTAPKRQPIQRGPNLRLKTKQQVALLSLCMRNRSAFVVGGVVSFWEKVTKQMSERDGKGYKLYAIKRIAIALGNGKAKEPQEAGETVMEWFSMRQRWAEVFARGPQVHGHLANTTRGRQSVDDSGNLDHNARRPSQSTSTYRLIESRKRSATPESPSHKVKRRARGMKQIDHEIFFKTNIYPRREFPGAGGNT